MTDDDRTQLLLEAIVEQQRRRDRGDLARMIEETDERLWADLCERIRKRTGIALPSSPRPPSSLLQELLFSDVGAPVPPVGDT